MIKEYLESLIEKPFEWHTNDCYTFIRDYLKLKYNKEIIKLNYCNELSALREAKKYKWENDLQKDFEIEILQTPENGDIVLIESGGFQCCHLYYKKKLYSIDRVYGLVATPYFIYYKTAKIIIRIIKPL